ncbi:MAG: LPS export ABC transporter permease LptF [Burkholderiaceae bacterium]
MLFTRALKRELRSIAGIVFATVFTIMVTTSLVRFLGRAATGNVDSASVLPLIAFSSINILGPLLVLTLFVAVLMTLTRAWRDSEMVIWQASGMSLAAWIRPVLGFALPFALVAGFVSLVLSPWANQQILDYQQRFAQREDISMVAAGQFRESSSSDRVFFVESLNEDETEVRNVFVTQQAGDRLIVVASRGGRIEQRDDGERYLVLENGRRYDGNLTDAELRLMAFERYGLRLEPQPVERAAATAKSKPTQELFAAWQPADRAEMVKRIGVPISALLLALLAIPLSSANPRVGRSINLVVALLLYMVYANLLSVSQTWVVQEKLSFAIGVWIVHAGAALLVTVMFWRRLTLGWRWPRLRRTRRLHAA